LTNLVITEFPLCWFIWKYSR